MVHIFFFVADGNGFISEGCSYPVKTNPKKIALIGLAASVVFGTSGCSFIHNNEPKVYGPPEAVQEEENTDSEEAKLWSVTGIFLKIKNGYYIFLSEEYKDYETRLYKISPAIDKENDISFDEYTDGNIVEITYATIGELEPPVMDVLSIKMIDDITEISEADQKDIDSLIAKYKEYMN